MGKYRLAVLIAGASAVISQSLNIREGLVLFSGNELTFGIMLGGWLAGTGLGGLLGGRRTGAGNPTRVLTALFGLLVSANVFAHIFLRFAPFIFGLPYGEVVSLERMIYISLVALVPCGMILGAIFPVASRLIPAVEAYMYEGIGSFLGGILCAVVLIPMLPALGILVILISLVLLGLALVHGHRWLWVLALLPLALVFKINGIEFSLRKIAGGKRELISTVETKYGRSSVFRSGQQATVIRSKGCGFKCQIVTNTHVQAAGKVSSKLRRRQHLTDLLARRQVELVHGRADQRVSRQSAGISFTGNINRLAIRGQRDAF